MLIYILLIILSTIIFISHIYVKDEKGQFCDSICVGIVDDTLCWFTKMV